MLPVSQFKIIRDNLQNGTLPLMRRERSEEEEEADKWGCRKIQQRPISKPKPDNDFTAAYVRCFTS